MSIAPAFGGPHAKKRKKSRAGGDRWRTPPALVASCAARWGAIDMDLAAEPGASVAPRWWGPGGECEEAFSPRLFDCNGGWSAFYAGTKPSVCWCNPPFTKVAEFTALCAKLAAAGSTVIQVAKVVPEVRWWDLIWSCASQVWVPDRRIAFIHPETGRRVSGASHAHALVVWGPRLASERPAWRRCQLGPGQGVQSWG